jgi:hypothetical protein
MLASWLRMHYSETIDAAVASSAPIFNFVGMDPPYPPNSFAAAVTADATPEVGGAAAACAPNVRSGWRALAFLSGHGEDAAAEHGENGAGDDVNDVDGNKRKKQRSRREAAAEAMRLCDAREKGADLLERRSGFLAARSWLSSAWDYMAMGDFPYATSYMTNGQGELPAFPVRAACEWLADPALADWEGAAEDEDEDEAADVVDGGSSGNTSNSTAKELGALKLLEAMTNAAGVFFNYTGADVECYEPAGGEDPLLLSSSAARYGNSGDANAAANATTDQQQQLRVSPQMLAAARQFLSPEDTRALERVAAGVSSSSSGARSSSNDSTTAADNAADANLLGSGDDPTALDAFLWDWQYCSEMLMPFGKDGVNDFYWNEPWDLDATIETCKNNWAGLAPRVGWAPAHYGSRGALRSATRITFPSGALDPWRPGSPLEVPPQASAHSPPLLDAFTLPSGAHHIDTFFSDPADPPDVTAGRRRILDLLAQWLDDARAERAAQRRREVGGGVEDGGERQQQQVEQEQEGVV